MTTNLTQAPVAYGDYIPCILWRRAHLSTCAVPSDCLSILASVVTIYDAADEYFGINDKNALYRITINAYIIPVIFRRYCRALSYL